MAMKQLVIAWTTELNCEIVSDLDASAGLGRPYERRVLRRMRRRPLLRCCGLFVWFGGVVGCERFDAIDDVGRWIDVWMSRKKEERRVEKQQDQTIFLWLHQGMRCRRV